jgi:murein tripeptide amidase MpaA
MTKIMNVREIASALVYFSRTYPQLCRRVKLPEKTYEKRTSYALSIGKNAGRETPTVLVIGGVHAREWGGPDIVVNFAGDLLRAYEAGKGLRYLNKSFSGADVAQIVETMNVVVFPCVNPDGVEFSHTKTHYYWRKNRNPASARPGKPNTVGVDINRNYDFLWDFKRYFHPASYRNDNSVGSTHPGQETFHGTEPFSEPETRNVKWLMDQLPKMALFMDVHSYGGDVLYSWGVDQDQCTDPAMTFSNPEWDLRRGRMNDIYREYISPADYMVTTEIAAAVATAMRAVRGAQYKAMPSVDLYPTAGTSTDYCFARHIFDPSLAKTFSYTIEFNIGKEDNTFLAPGNPTVMDETVRDVVPGLIELCLSMPKALPHALAPRAANAPKPAPSFQSPLGRNMTHLLTAFESVASLDGAAGKTARKGILKAMEEAARGTGAKDR